MLVQIYCAKCIGIDAVKVLCEIKIERGIGIHLVGLGDAAVKESLLRTTTALASLGYNIPGKKIVINLAPADLHKNGSGFDVPIATGIIAASGQKSLPGLGKYLIMGELGLDGEVRGIPGGLPFAEFASKCGLKGCILPTVSAREAIDIDGIDIYGASNFQDVIRILEENEDCSDLLVRNEARKSDNIPVGGNEPDYIDFADIIGQENAKRGAEIAVSGGHNMIMIGTPGSGKSSIAKAMAGIMPPMSLEESLATSKIYSICGKGDLRYGLVRQRPFRSPHYSASIAAVIGGGGDGIYPGEISLAHNGILFLDEIGQMPRSLIESLRSPIEDGKVVISRLKGKVEYPCSFMLVAASNPCPCGYYGDGDRCNCSPLQRSNYLSKLSGPMMDRIDIQVWVKSPLTSDMLSDRKAESSSVIAARVAKAREIQQRRFSGEGIYTNAGMNNRMIEKYCPLNDECRNVLNSLMEKTGLSMRAYFRIIRVARTIADMDDEKDILPHHLMEAAGYRFLDKV